MKLFQAFVSALVGGLVLSLAVGAHAQSTTKQYATIVRIEGEARYSPGDNVWHPLTVGQTLGPGNVIQTAANSRVDMVLGDKVTSRIVPAPDKVGPATDSNVRGMISYKAKSEQNVIRMESDTVLAIDKLLISNMGADAVSDTELDLRKGSIFGNVKKLSAASQFLIKTPNGIAGVRGTTFSLSVDPTTAATLAQVLAGSLVVSETTSNGTTTKVVNSMQALDALGQIINLPQQAIDFLESESTFTVTIVQGVISFANDKSTVVISPTSTNK